MIDNIVNLLNLSDESLQLLAKIRVAVDVDGEADNVMKSLTYVFAIHQQLMIDELTIVPEKSAEIHLVAAFFEGSHTIREVRTDSPTLGTMHSISHAVTTTSSTRVSLHCLSPFAVLIQESQEV
jgi:hypothetical protein